jgi:hypothetical protein
LNIHNVIGKGRQHLYAILNNHLMNKFHLLVFSFFLVANALTGQSLTVKCVEKERKNPDGETPIIVRTCWFKKFKFKETSYPDHVGRYFYSEHEVYVLVNKKYIKTVNSNVFNKKQHELVSIINKRIQKDFKELLSDSTNADCFTELRSVPAYKMDELDLSFHDDKIWFEANWDMTSACLAVSGTIVSFKLSEIRKYLK